MQGLQQVLGPGLVVWLLSGPGSLVLAQEGVPVPSNPEQNVPSAAGPHPAGAMDEDPERARSQPPMGEGSAFRSLAVSAGFQEVGGSRGEMLGADGLPPGSLVAPAHKVVPHEVVSGGDGEEHELGEPDAGGTETHATVEHQLMPPEAGGSAPGFTLYLEDPAGRLGATPVVRVGAAIFKPADDGHEVDQVALDGTFTVMIERYDAGEQVEILDSKGREMYSGVVRLDPDSDEPGMVVRVSPGTPRFSGFR